VFLQELGSSDDLRTVFPGSFPVFPVDTVVIPSPVIKRLPKYLRMAQHLRSEGVEWVSSNALSDALDLTSSTVRQDLSHLELTGIAKKGYETQVLERVIRDLLMTEQDHSVFIVGAGHLGKAMALHGGFAEHGFVIRGIFDADPKLHGRKIGSLRVEPVASLKKHGRRRRNAIGIIAVPPETAQQVAEQLIEAGVHALLNMTCTHLRVPDHVHVAETRIIGSLQELVYAMKG